MLTFCEVLAPCLTTFSNHTDDRHLEVLTRWVTWKTLGMTHIQTEGYRLWLMRREATFDAQESHPVLHMMLSLINFEPR